MKIKYGVFDKQGRKIAGVLGVDGKEVYVEINGKIGRASCRERV